MAQTDERLEMSVGRLSFGNMKLCRTLGPGSHKTETATRQMWLEEEHLPRESVCPTQICYRIFADKASPDGLGCGRRPDQFRPGLGSDHLNTWENAFSLEERHC